MVSLGFWLAALSVLPAVDDISKYLFPKETKRLAIINFNAIRDSGYWTEEINEGFERGLRDNEQFERITKLMEINPQHLEQFTICETNTGQGPERLFFIIRGQFAYEKAAKGLEEMGKSGELTSLTIHDLPVYYNHRSREASYFALVDDHTLVMSPGKNLLTDALDGLKELREPSKELADRLNAKALDSFAFRLAGVIPDEAKRGLKQVPQFEPIADDLVSYDIVGSLGESPRLQVRLTMSDETAASQCVNALTALIAFAKLTGGGARPDLIALLDKVSVKSDELEVLAELTVTQKQFGDLVVQGREDREKMRARFKERRERRLKMKDNEKKDNPPADATKKPAA